MSILSAILEILGYRSEMLMREQRAVVKESLRIAMPVPGMLPRIVPATSTPFVVDGKVVPPGVISSPR